jgi:hypothetical protein
MPWQLLWWVVSNGTIHRKSGKGASGFSLEGLRSSVRVPGRGSATTARSAGLPCSVRSLVLASGGTLTRTLRSGLAREGCAVKRRPEPGKKRTAGPATPQTPGHLQRTSVSFGSWGGSDGAVRQKRSGIPHAWPEKPLLQLANGLVAAPDQKPPALAGGVVTWGVTCRGYPDGSRPLSGIISLQRARTAYPVFSAVTGLDQCAVVTRPEAISHG